MARRFAINTWVWSPDLANFQELADKARKMGFDGIEIPTSQDTVDVAALKDALNAGRKLTPLVVLGGRPDANIASKDLAISRNGIELVKNRVQICTELGGSLVAGPLYATPRKNVYLTDAERSATLKRVAEAFKEIALFAKDRSVNVALEPVCRYDTYLINTAKQGRELIEMIGEDNIGLLLDIFHLNIEEKSFYEAILTAGDKLFHFHACDNDRGTVGSGSVVRWDDVRRGLDGINYDKWIAIESFTPYDKDFATARQTWRKLATNQDEIASKGLKFLRRVLA